MVQALAEGYIVGDSVTVLPTDAKPGDTIQIRTTFRNDSWLPACGTIEILLDGVVIDTWTNYYVGLVCLLGGEVLPWNITYPLPTSIRPGIHRVEAREVGQTTITAMAEFTVTAIAPPGQRNVSFTSTPTDAQIFVSGGYIGNTPITVPLSYGTYDVTVVYGNQEISRNISVVAGMDTIDAKFTFTQKPPFDLTKWLADNQWYIAGAVIGGGLLLFALKKPETAKRAASTAKSYATKAYHKGKEMIK